jgi:hypothetical protein
LIKEVIYNIKHNEKLRFREVITHTGFWWGNMRERHRLEDLGIDGRIILKWIFKKWDGGHGLD